MLVGTALQRRSVAAATPSSRKKPCIPTLLILFKTLGPFTRYYHRPAEAGTQRQLIRVDNLLMCTLPGIQTKSGISLRCLNSFLLKL